MLTFLPFLGLVAKYRVRTQHVPQGLNWSEESVGVLYTSVRRRRLFLILITLSL